MAILSSAYLLMTNHDRPRNKSVCPFLMSLLHLTVVLTVRQHSIGCSKTSPVAPQVDAKKTSAKTPVMSNLVIEQTGLQTITHKITASDKTPNHA